MDPRPVRNERARRLRPCRASNCCRGGRGWRPAAERPLVDGHVGGDSAARGNPSGPARRGPAAARSVRREAPAPAPRAPRRTSASRLVVGRRAGGPPAARPARAAAVARPRAPKRSPATRTTCPEHHKAQRARRRLPTIRGEGPGPRDLAVAEGGFNFRVATRRGHPRKPLNRQRPARGVLVYQQRSPSPPPAATARGCRTCARRVARRRPSKVRRASPAPGIGRPQKPQWRTARRASGTVSVKARPLPPARTPRTLFVIDRRACPRARRVTYAAQAGCGSRGRAGGGWSAPPQRPMSGQRPAPGMGGGGGAGACPAAGRAARRAAGRGVVRVQPPARLARLRRARRRIIGTVGLVGAAVPAGLAHGAGGRRDEARATVRPSGRPSSNGQRDKARLSTTRGPGPTAPKHREGPADGARRCGQPRVLRGRGAQIGITVMRTLQIGLFPHHPRAGKTRRDFVARVSAADACVKRFPTLGKPGAQMQRRSPQHKSQIALAAPPAAPSGVGVPRPGCPALTRSALAAIAT